MAQTDHLHYTANTAPSDYAIVKDVDFSSLLNSAPLGTLTSVSLPYQITTLGSGKVAGTIPSTARQKL